MPDSILATKVGAPAEIPDTLVVVVDDAQFAEDVFFCCLRSVFTKLVFKNLF